MQDIFKELLRILENDEPCVLATVVKTTGSTPQKAGAKLLIRKDGGTVGTLGGGCVEGEIWSLAKQILQNHGSPLFRRFDLNEEFAARDGMVCGGTMYFFVDPIEEYNCFIPFAAEIMCVYQGSSPVAIATTVNNPGGKSHLGAKMLIKQNGTFQGSLNDEKLDLEAIKTGKRIAVSGGNIIFQTEDGTEIFVEGYNAPPTLILIGGGHVNKAVSTIASTLGFRIYVVDDRGEYVQRDRFPEAEGIVVDDYRDSLENVPAHFNSYIVVATRGHRYDDLALYAAVQTPARFIGLLGSKRKSLEIFKSLLKQNISPDRIKEIHAPIGLDIGALTPEEIAISILAEILMIRHGGDGSPMHMKEKLLDKLQE